MRVVVLDDWAGVAEGCTDWTPLRARAEVVFLRDALRGEALRAALQGAQVILPMRERTRLEAPLLAALPELRLIALTGATTRHLHMPTVQAQGITLCWSGAYHPEDTSEFAFALMLAAEKGIATGAAAMAAGGFMAGTGLGRRLAGRTLGILGHGRIGARLARLALAMDMQVLAWGRSLTEGAAAAQGITAASFDRVLAESDVVSLHMVLSEETTGIIGPRELSLMKPGALLVNTARGPMVQEAALIAALQAGRIRAALDVFDVEPLPPAHPLRNLPGALLVPHMGYATQECMGMFYAESIQNILAWMDGRPIRLLDRAGLTP